VRAGPAEAAVAAVEVVVVVAEAGHGHNQACTPIADPMAPTSSPPSDVAASVAAGAGDDLRCEERTVRPVCPASRKAYAHLALEALGRDVHLA